MSVTKLLVGTVIGRAVALGLLDIDQPAHTWFDEWRTGPRAAITVRHVMGHVSGLAPDTWPQLNAAPPDDLLGHVLRELPMVAAPATTWAYNNAAVMVLPALVSRAAGEPFLDFVRRELFDPLQVGDWSWAGDKAGHPFGMARASLSTTGLAAVGRLLAQDGRWAGVQLLPPDWVATCLVPPLAGVRGAGLLLMQSWATTPPDDEPVALGHDGWGGQHLWVFPHSGMVLSRLSVVRSGVPGPDFPDLVPLAAAVDDLL